MGPAPVSGFTFGLGVVTFRVSGGFISVRRVSVKYVGRFNHGNILSVYWVVWTGYMSGLVKHGLLRRCVFLSGVAIRRLVCPVRNTCRAVVSFTSYKRA